MANKIVAAIHSTAAPSLFLDAAYAFHCDLGLMQNRAPVATGSKSRNTPEIIVPILKRQDSQLVALRKVGYSFGRCSRRNRLPKAGCHPYPRQ